MKRTGEKAKEEVAESFLFWPRFPQRSGLARKVFFETLPEQDAAKLKTLGYEPVVLMALARDTARDHQDYLFGLLQGMTDGTIDFDKQRIDAAELELRARHMLNRDSTLSRASSRDESDLDEVWNWERGTNTLQGNTTFTSPADIQKFVQEQRDKRYGKGGKPAGVELAVRKLRRKDKKKQV